MWRKILLTICGKIFIAKGGRGFGAAKYFYADALADFWQEAVRKFNKMSPIDCLSLTAY